MIEYVLSAADDYWVHLAHPKQILAFLGRAAEAGIRSRQSFLFDLLYCAKLVEGVVAGAFVPLRLACQGQTLQIRKLHCLIEPDNAFNTGHWPERCIRWRRMLGVPSLL